MLYYQTNPGQNGRVEKPKTGPCPEKRGNTPPPPASHSRGGRGFDPTEDTERKATTIFWKFIIRPAAEASIRLRILKVVLLVNQLHGDFNAAEASIRLRILKVYVRRTDSKSHRWAAEASIRLRILKVRVWRTGWKTRSAAEASIRLRILKGVAQNHMP
jgi:hypothetical protein